jgi:hypothetical protein
LGDWSKAWIADAQSVGGIGEALGNDVALGIGEESSSIVASLASHIHAAAHGQSTGIGDGEPQFTKIALSEAGSRE